jgi:predicted naringenin-chalcone synthase
MNLLLRRDQRSSMLGSAVFSLEVRADISAAERANIAKYKLGKAILYTKSELVDRGSGLLGLASRLTFKAMNISVSVDDLAGGKRIECKDILEMLAVEEQIKQAAQTFKQVLEAAAHFGGEEVIAI